jgi:hypothetical protein
LEADISILVWPLPVSKTNLNQVMRQMNP